MRIPRLPHTATCITPAAEDDRGNVKLVYDVPPATSKTYNSVWVQQNSSDEKAEDGRVPTVMVWSLIVVAPDDEFTDKQRWVWNGTVFEVFGMPEPCYTLKKYHHTEVRLKRISG